MSKTHILQVVGAMNCGGAESMIMNLFRSIDKEKFQFHFLYYTNDKCYYDDEIKYLGGTIHRLSPFSQSNIMIIIKDLQDLMRKQSIDVVHAHTSLSIGVVMYAARRAGVPIRIAHSHTTVDSRKASFFRNMYNVGMKNLIKRYSNRYLMCGKEAGKFLYGDKYFKKAVILPNAIDLNKYDVSMDIIDKAKDSLSISKDTLIIGQVGAFKETKNYKFTLKVARELKSRGINYKMLFAGEGELMDNCIEYAKQLDVEDNILFLGNRSDIHILMNVFDVLIMPSLYEGLPVTLIEAQATGLPSVISDNISRECDLELDLITFLSLDDSISNWVDNIVKESNKEKKDVKTIETRIKTKGYSIEESVELVSEIYNGR